MIYAQLHNGRPEEIAPGQPFRTYTQRVDDAAEAAYSMSPIGSFVAVENSHSPDALEQYDAGHLARFGIQAIDNAWAVPAGQMVTGYTLAVTEAGAISAHPTFGPAPVVRRDIPKSVVTQRLGAIGKAATVFGALQSDPEQFALWFAPDWPSIYADDARVLGLLQACGLTPDEIATVLA